MSISNEAISLINKKENLDKRPSWDNYYMSIAYVVAQRSFDPSTKCGCVIVSKNNRILSTGYNGPIKNSIDEKIPLARPDKYDFFIHAETNAILSYCGSYQDIQDSTAYITGKPCINCLRTLLQKGIIKIIYGKQNIKCVNDESEINRKIILESLPIVNQPIIREVEGDFVDILKRTISSVEG